MTETSPINPRDGIVLQTELEDHGDKQAVERRSSEVLSTQLTDCSMAWKLVGSLWQIQMGLLRPKTRGNK